MDTEDVPLLEREAQLASLGEYAAEARCGDGRMVLVAGEAGVGKTRLVAELVARARRQGLLPLTGWCVEHGDEITPLAPVADIVRELLARTPKTDLDDALGAAGVDLAGLLPDFDPTGESRPPSAGVGRCSRVC